MTATFADLVEGRDAVRQHDRAGSSTAVLSSARRVRAATADSRISGSCHGRARIDSPTQIES